MKKWMISGCCSAVLRLILANSVVVSICCGKTFFLIMQFRTLAKTCFWIEILDSRFRGNDKVRFPQQLLVNFG